MFFRDLLCTCGSSFARDLLSRSATALPNQSVDCTLQEMVGGAHPTNVFKFTECHH